MKVEVELSELLKMSKSDPQPALGLEVGQQVFIRTVTYHYTGRVLDVVGGAVVLEKACWIADSGRYSEFIRSGEPEESEQYLNAVWISLATIVDWTLIAQLPEGTK